MIAYTSHISLTIFLLNAEPVCSDLKRVNLMRSRASEACVYHLATYHTTLLEHTVARTSHPTTNAMFRSRATALTLVRDGVTSTMSVGVKTGIVRRYSRQHALDTSRMLSTEGALVLEVIKRMMLLCTMAVRPTYRYVRFHSTARF